MTVRRNDTHSTEFGLWLREQDEIDSSLGFVATNLDFVWCNYKLNKYMLIEEKRYNSRPKLCQQLMFKRIDDACKNDPRYCGFYYLIFENTSPDDGLINLFGDVMNLQIKHTVISNSDFLRFLRFEYNPFR